jgi:hypothetical protein
MMARGFSRFHNVFTPHFKAIVSLVQAFIHGRGTSSITQSTLTKFDWYQILFSITIPDLSVLVTQLEPWQLHPFNFLAIGEHI